MVWSFLKKLKIDLPYNPAIPLLGIYIKEMKTRFWPYICIPGLPWWLRQQKICLQCKRPGFNPWIRKIPWRREWQPTPVFLPGESHGHSSLAGDSPWCCKELDMTEQLTIVCFLMFTAALLTIVKIWKQPDGHQQISSVQSLSRVQLFEIPWTIACQASLSITNSWSPPKLMSIESVMPSNHLFLCPPLPLLPSIFPSIRVFSNESVLRVRWPNYWSFSFNISSSNEHSGLISFRMDWLDLLAVQGTLKCLLQHYSSKASILQCSAFFIVQLSHPYMTTGKTIALTIQINE